MTLANPLLEEPPLEPGWTASRIALRKQLRTLPGEIRIRAFRRSPGHRARAQTALPQFLKSPPEAWFSYPETRGLS